MTLDSVAGTYDEEPYANLTHSLTHPDLLATIGRLLGMTPAAVDQCRVLELGCAAGANIAALAEVLPGTEFVGIDFSEREIREGKAALGQMGLSNVRLEWADIRALEPLELGTFDYIIAHGVYSWVPADVRERLLAACKRMLNPHGVAYVSYNAYPGWHMMRGIHDALRYRTRGTTSRHERATEAEAFARFLRTAVTPPDGPYSQMVAAYEAHIESRRRSGGDRGAALLVQDELAEVNDPFYFHEFAAEAATHGLQYLGDADFPSVFPTKLPREAQPGLGSLANDIIELQQYLDFVTNASFHRTLLCHGDVLLSRRLGADLTVFRRLFVGSPARAATAELDLSPGVVQTFIGEDGARLAIDSPIGKAAMSILCARYPARIPFPELLAEARARVTPGPAGDGDAEAQLVGVLLQGFCYSFSLVELRTVADRFTMAPGAQPRTSAFARLLADAGVDSVTNLRHRRLTLDPFRLRLVSLCDGDRTREKLVDQLVEDVDSGAIQRRDGAIPGEDARAFFETAVGQAIESLAGAAMFLA